jgi:DNA-directed RNA polymerase specialized sigma24 family protein
MVLKAGEQSDSRAANDLCRLYWSPLYHFARAQGLGHEDGCDVVQDFFSVTLRTGMLTRADAERGKFRSYLVTCFKHHLIASWRKGLAEKRGGSCTFVSMEEMDAECGLVAADAVPEVVFDRQWARALMQAAAERLAEEMTSLGHGQRLLVLEPFLTADAGQSYATAAARLGVDEGRVKTWIHRLRQRRAKILRELVAETVDDAEQVDDELRYLLTVVS